MEPLQTWWTTELYPTSDEDNFGVVGNFEVVKAADTQATIAALQDERDGWVRSREHYYQLWMRATDERDEMRKERDEFEAQLTQRTAELEAAKAIQAIDLKNNNAYREQVATLQAELERVRGQYEGMLAMVKALPLYKDISVSHRINEHDYESWHVWADHNPLAECDTEEEANAIKALYEHRQGMEG